MTTRNGILQAFRHGGDPDEPPAGGGTPSERDLHDVAGDLDTALKAQSPLERDLRIVAEGIAEAMRQVRALERALVPQRDQRVGDSTEQLNELATQFMGLVDRYRSGER